MALSLGLIETFLSLWSFICLLITEFNYRPQDIFYSLFNPFSTNISLLYPWKHKKSVKKSKKVALNFRFKAIPIVSEKKSFCRSRVLEPNCKRKETINIDILITLRNGVRKVTQTTGITSELSSRIKKRNQISLFRWTFANIVPTEDFDWRFVQIHIWTTIHRFKSRKNRTKSSSYPFL